MTQRPAFPLAAAVAALAAAAAWAGPAVAQHVGEPPGRESKPGAATAAPAGEADRDFAQTAGRGHYLAIGAANEALKRSRESEVRELARAVLGSHKVAADLLASVGGPAGVAVGENTDGASGDRLGALLGTTGDEFDRAFAEFQVETHEALVPAYASEAESGTNPKIRNMARETLPTLQRDLEAARELRADLGREASR